MGMPASNNLDELERLFQSRNIVGIPFSNFAIVLSVFLAVFRNVFFRLLKPSVAKFTDNGMYEEIKEHEYRKRHEAVWRKGQKYVYHLFFFALAVAWEIRLGLIAPWFHFFYNPSAIERTAATQGYGMVLREGKSVDYDTRDEPWMQEFHLFLVVQLAWYAHNFIEDTLWDRARGDFALMVTHHMLTISLIIFSLQFGFEYLGFFILVPMDIMDLVLYMAKTYHLFSSTVDGKPTSAVHQVGQKIGMTFIFLAWCVLRIGYFNTIIYAMYNAFQGRPENVFTLHPRYAKEGVFRMRDYPYVGQCAYVMLYMLAFLQTLWGVMIGRCWWTAVRTGFVKDKIFATYPTMPPHKKNE